MLFVATHRHTAEMCPADSPGPIETLNSPEHARECGVKVMASYTAPPEHLLYFIVEADEFSSVVRYFRPVMKIGETRITPVLSTGEAVTAVTAPSRRGSQRRA